MIPSSRCPEPVSKDIQESLYRKDKAVGLTDVVSVFTGNGKLNSYYSNEFSLISSNGMMPGIIL